MSEFKYRIGYIDENYAQVEKYARRLEEFDIEVIGYDIHSGITLSELMDQVYSSDIDLLMIDYKLNESNVVPFNGEEVEHAFYATKPLFPHIIFTNKRDEAEQVVEDWKIIFDKTKVFETELSSKRFATILIKSIEQYKNLVASKKEKMAKLLEKGEDKGLSSEEKHELLLLRDQLNNLDNSQRAEVPLQLITPQKLDEISKTRKEAEEFLKSLMEEGDTNEG